MPEMQPPEKIEPQSLGDYLEVMSKAVFQSGMSWKVVEAKWPSTREAFRGFDVGAVATMDDGDVAALVKDTRVIRNRRKIEAIVTNARRLLELDEAHGSFAGYLGSLDGFEAQVEDLKKQFKFLGDTGSHFVLWVVGQDAPACTQPQET